MTSPAPQDRPPRRDLDAIVADGVFFSAMVGLGETYVPAFVLAAGLGEVVAGLAATLPLLAGGLFQLVTPVAVRRLRSYRRWVVLCACVQAASFVPLVVGAVAGRITLGWVAASTVAYWAAGMGTSPAWNAWVTSLVPAPIRTAFFARRTRAAQASVMLGVLAGGLLLEWGRRRDLELALFALLFALAALARLASARCLSLQSESPGVAAAHRALPPGAIWSAIRAANSVRVLGYLLGMQVVVNFAAPYFTPYLLGPLAFSYGEFMVLTAASFLARVAVLPILGRIAHERGTRALLWWGAVGIAPLPALWLAADAFLPMLALQLWAGCAWAAVEFATLLAFFEHIEEGDRASVLTAFNLGTAAAVALGAAVGSALFAQVGASAGAYAWVFAASAAGRFGVLLVLRGTRPTRAGAWMELRTLAVRPSAGAIQRPVLASLETQAPPREAADDDAQAARQAT